MKNLVKDFLQKFITDRRGNLQISQSREISTPPDREMKIASDSLICPYCASKNFVKRGFRTKTLERVQLLLCSDCHKTFTPQITKGKHYPLATIFDAVSLYNLGHSLEESCRIVNKETNPQGSSNFGIGASTLANWYKQFLPMMPFERMREYAMKKYSPKNMVVTATLAHRQLYRYRFHRAKCELMIAEEYKHRRFIPLKEFLEMVPVECPHQYFQDGLRASETPLTFSKTAMIVRSKTNFATKTAGFVLQSVKERTGRHEAIQKFMLYNDSVTVATEVPVYLTRDDIEHMKTQLGFQIFNKPERDKLQKDGDNNGIGTTEEGLTANSSSESHDSSEVELVKLPKLITGHIDILQIRNGQIHILDYKPKAEKERPIEQLTLYAMALSRLTGLRLYEFKCGWFDEKDYFEFFPLHVLHKPRKAVRRRNVETMEGTYQVNKEVAKIKNVRPNL